MKIFLIKIISFAASLLPMYLAALILIFHTNTAKYIPNVLDKSKNDGFLLSRLRDIPDYKHVDLLFLGSSHACREFDPRIFNNYGYTSFNLGSSAQTPINSEFLLRKYVDVIKPKHLIFEVYFLFFAGNGIESSIDILSNSELDVYNLGIALSKVNLKAYNTIASILVNRMLQPLHKIKQQEFENEKYIRGGYIEKILKDSINQKMSFAFIKQKITLRSEQLIALRKIIELSIQKGIKVTLVSAPVTKEFLSQFENYTEFNNVIRNISDEYGIDYVDYNLKTPAFNTYSDFYDSNHLNQYGVAKFNEDFIKNYLMRK